MRRFGLALVALLAAPAAHAATIEISPQPFSPAAGRLTIDGSLTLARKVGVRLASASGTPLGWISPPVRRQEISLEWDGRLGGRPVHDGYYRVQLRYAGKTLASVPLRLDLTAPYLASLRISNGGAPAAGDNRLLATISPNGDGFRDRAEVGFRLTEPGTVTLSAETTRVRPRAIFIERSTFEAGWHNLVWAPSAAVEPRTYVMRLSVVDQAGNRRTYGALDQEEALARPSPVVRLQGVDAGATRESYAPGETANLAVATDARSLTVQVFRSGVERVATKQNNVMNGVPVTEPQSVGWFWRERPHLLNLPIGAWPTGLYYAQLTADDGRVGYAPFVVRPPLLGEHRVAVVLPTNTWQAYNFRDENGDGWGDTWYAGPPNLHVRLGRPYLHRGVPPHFRLYDLSFLRWLAVTTRQVDYISDSDLGLFADGVELARDYDLVVFPGHEEYVTEHVYDVVQEYRDLGGNLIFLSANNFFWRVDREGRVLRRVAQWRQLGRPEAALIGVQYRGNDDGQRQKPYVVKDIGGAPWLFEGTGLGVGSPFGYYGIEIDAMTPESPPGTKVLAEIPDLYGPGFNAQMTYYETPEGAKVFAAGALTFGGSAMVWPQRRMLSNLWDRLSVP